MRRDALVVFMFLLGIAIDLLYEHFRDVPSNACSCELPLLCVCSYAFRNCVGGFLIHVYLNVGNIMLVGVYRAACGCHALFFS